MTADSACPLCAGASADADLMRVQTWEDERWRLTTSLVAETSGFSYLEPKRHVADVAALEGEEAATLGPVLGRVTRALKQATGCELVYVYVFGGGIPHLHIHLAPHTDGDALNETMIKGEIEERRLDSGAVVQTSKEFPALPEGELREVAERIRARLG